MNRTHALGCLLLVVLLAGCVGGGGEIAEEDLTGEQTYEWDTNETVTLNLSVSSQAYTAVVDIQNRSNLTVHSRNAFTGENPVQIEALQFRFQNGTVVNATHGNLTATMRSEETRIELPAENGTVAYTASRSGRTFTVPVFVEGSYRLDLPEGTRVSIPVLSRVSPRGYESRLENGQPEIRWEELERGSIVVRYYLVRDLYLFGAIFIVGTTLGIAGTLYYWREIRRLKQRREDVGLDVDYDDDEFDDGPPPGMR